MRWRRSSWLFLSLAILLAVAVFMLRSSRSPEQKVAGVPAASSNQPVAQPPTPTAPAVATTTTSATNSPAPTSSTTASAPATNRFPYRLSNTTKGIGDLMRNDRAVLLANAFIDTSRPADLAIPAHLRSQGDPGAYVVQSRGPINDAFRRLLAEAGATIVSYIPNNAYLVRISAGGARQLASSPRTQTVLPYEPYYKLSDSLLKAAVGQQPLAPNSGLKLTLFADAKGATLAALEKLGAHVVAEERSPFGPVVTVQAPLDSVPAVAGLTGVQGLDLVHQRAPANDLSRVRMGVSTDSTTNANYLGLTGAGILVNVNDSGVDATQVELAPRVTGNSPQALQDSEGHGTHVAGIIASSGSQSATVTNASGSATNANFRGKAQAANIYSQLINVIPGATGNTDADLQEGAANTNALISNNSWGYVNETSYDIASASYDAAVRDALPGVTGSQPVLFVFAAGNEGFGSDTGTSGDADSIRSPGTAKNVITVGAFELPRNITNEVAQPSSPQCATTYQTNTPFLGLTDSSNKVASFSSRGNVGIGTEGVYGRFKPDVVAPGTFVVSTRSGQWDTNAYYNPTNYQYNTFFGQIVATNTLNQYSVFVPCGAVQLIIYVWGNNADLPIFVRLGGAITNNLYDVLGTNLVALPPAAPLTTDVTYNYAIGNGSSNEAFYNVTTVIVTTNDFGNYFQVLKSLNDGLGPYYRYESGTSMAAPGVSGMLALMQEFLEQRTQSLFSSAKRPSPALMKAMVINGGRSLSSSYDMQVNNGINYQGWGRANLPTSLPGTLSNAVTQVGSPTPILIFDQEPENALATGQSRTWNVALGPDAQGDPLRVTLVWTDPPGNPNAALKLVNNLDLVVTNLDTGEVFAGNDIPATAVFNQSLDTNFPPVFDVVNNVENVYIEQALGSNFSITILGRAVNVNAVTANTNGITQDYALVISSGDSTTTNALVLSPAAPVVTELTTNVMYLNAASNGFPILRQHVGANFSLMVSTNGTTNQWHFYVVTNLTGFTNYSFVTFLPPELSVPRMGVRERDLANAVRFEADIDLFVSRDPALLYLDPTALAAAEKSQTRGGTESIVLTNSAINDVYYIGVESQDQEAAEYGFLSVFSESPFAENTDNGVKINGVTVPQAIPDGSPDQPNAALIFGINPYPMKVRRVVVTNDVVHENFGDLLGDLSHNGRFAVLNNHTFGNGTTNQSFIYEDNGEGDIPGSQHTDGPGSLREFVGEEAAGVWLLAMVDNALEATGTVMRTTISIDKEQESGTTVTIAAGGSFFDSIDVPPEATNLTVSITGNTLPMILALRRDEFPTPLVYDKVAIIPAPGGALSLTTRDFPPLQAGRYFILVYNPNTIPQTITLFKQLFLDLNGVSPLTFSNAVPMPLLDDAVTNFTLTVPNSLQVARAEVGLRIDHPRVADLALTLISPFGTRILLSENRGGLSTEGFGSSLNITNSLPANSSGGPAANTNLFNAGATNGVVRIDYDFQFAPDQMEIRYEGVPIFNSGMIPGAGTFYVPYGPGTSSIVAIIMNGGGNTNTNPPTVWSYVATSIQSTHNYAVFTEQVFDGSNSNSFFTPKPIKLAPPPPPFSIPNYTGTNTALSNGIYFQPEETLESLNGESPRGDWQLEVLDNRVGATNPTPTLVSWQLRLVLDRAVPSVTPLTHGLPVTNSVGSNALSLFYVDVPLWAQFATNTLLTASGPVDVWFNQDALPLGAITNGDSLLMSAVTNGSFTLATNSFPPLVPGQRYYLAVQNLGSAPVTFTFLVEFDITTLSNAVPVTGVMGVNSYARYFQFDVSSNATAVTFALTNLSGNVNLVASKNLPLPSQFDFDYSGFNFGSNDELIVVFPNSTPVPLSAGRWYLGVLAADTNTVNYTIVAVEYTNALPRVITLTNAVPYFNFNSGVGGTNDYYRFVVSTNAVRAWFEILRPSGDVTLVARKGFPPLPDLANYDYISTNSGASNELIILNANSAPVPLTPGDWYLTAVNVSGVPVSYFIQATEFSYGTNATILSSQLLNGIFCLTWSSVPGVDYLVQITPTVTPTSWTNASPPLTASGAQTTYCLPLSSPGQFFFRVVTAQKPGNNGALPNIIPLSNGVAYANVNAGTNNPIDYYFFPVTTNAIRARFEIFNLTGNMNLFVRQGYPPLPDAANFDYFSANPGLAPELIYVLTNSLPVPLRGGGWFLSATNVSGGLASYSIRATEYPYGTNATILAAQSSGSNFCVTWSSVAGATYVLQGSPGVSPTAWTNIAPGIKATSVSTTFCVPLPSPYQYYRVMVEDNAGLNAGVPPQQFVVGVAPGAITLKWIALPAQQFQVQWTPSLAPPLWSTFTNIISSTNTAFTFVDDGSQTGGLFSPRYYRLKSYP